MKVYYVDRVRGADIALLAGPFASEAIARKYELAAMHATFARDDRSQFDSFGVVGIEDFEKIETGQLNAVLEIDPADLL